MSFRTITIAVVMLLCLQVSEAQELRRSGLTKIIPLIFLLFISTYVDPAIAQTSDQLGGVVSAKEAARWREDLHYMAEEMVKRHKNLFHTVTREQFERATKDLYERIPQLARHQIIVEMARIVAMIGDGHTNIYPTRDPKIGFHTLPVKFYIFKDGLFIRAAKREQADLVGARVLKIGNFSA